MFLKNVSFEMVQAVKEDTKTVVVFQPQEILEVSAADGNWFMERYNVGKMYFKEEAQTVQPVKVEEDLESAVAVNDHYVNVTEEEVDEEMPESEYICEVCEKDCKSAAGLKSHMRTHKL